MVCIHAAGVITAPIAALLSIIAANSVEGKKKIIDSHELC